MAVIEPRTTTVHLKAENPYDVKTLIQIDHTHDRCNDITKQTVVKYIVCKECKIQNPT